MTRGSPYAFYRDETFLGDPFSDRSQHRLPVKLVFGGKIRGDIVRCNVRELKQKCRVCTNQSDPFAERGNQSFLAPGSAAAPVTSFPGKDSKRRRGYVPRNISTVCMPLFSNSLHGSLDRFIDKGYGAYPNVACVEADAVGTISTEKPKFLTSLLIKFEVIRQLTDFSTRERDDSPDYLMIVVSEMAVQTYL